MECESLLSHRFSEFQHSKYLILLANSGTGYVAQDSILANSC